MSDITGIIEIVVIKRDELGQMTEYHFPIKNGDKYHATVSQEYVPGKEFPIGSEITVRGLGQLHKVDLEVTASIVNSSKPDDPPVMWFWNQEGNGNTT